MTHSFRLLSLGVDPRNVRYIKLGRSGTHEQKCIENGQCYIGFGSGNPTCFGHIRQAAVSGSESDWTKLWDYHYNNDQNGSEQSRRFRATTARNQLRAFYEAGDETLWITFHAGRLYYAFLDPDSEPICSEEDGGSFRFVSGQGWRCTDKNGDLLREETLSGQLVQTKSYRGTSCEVKDKARAYLLNRINCNLQPYQVLIENGLDQIIAGLREAIKSLSWKDFEILVELLFSRYLERYSVTGGVQDYSDMVFRDVLSSSMVSVQVKSQGRPAEFREYIEDEKVNGFGSFYFVYHTSSYREQDFVVPESVRPSVYVVSGDRIAEMVIEAGLISWVKDKSL